MVSSVYDPTTIQAQFTTFDPYAQQAQYEAMLQAEYARQQAEAAQQQQQYYALQMQATQFQATQFQPLVPQKTAVYGCVLPLCPIVRGTDVAHRQLKQPLCPTVPSTHTRTYVRPLLATAERIRNARPRAWSPTPALNCLRLVARVLAAPTHPHLVSCGRAGCRSWHEHWAGGRRHVREYWGAPLREHWVWKHCTAAHGCSFCVLIAPPVFNISYLYARPFTTTLYFSHYRYLCIMSNTHSILFIAFFYVPGCR